MLIVCSEIFFSPPFGARGAQRRNPQKGGGPFYDFLGGLAARSAASPPLNKIVKPHLAYNIIHYLYKQIIINT